MEVQTPNDPLPIIGFKYEGSPYFPKYDWHIYIRKDILEALLLFLGRDNATTSSIIDNIPSEYVFDLLREGTDPLDMVTKWSHHDYLPSIL